MVQLYPGVQTTRLPASGRSITPVGTSTTAFVGIFRKGPVNKAVRITSWGQFVEKFGGLWTQSEASFAIEHYFLNGGSVAYVVRTVWADSATPANNAKEATKAGFGPNTALLSITAKSEGTWGNEVYFGIFKDGGAGTFDLLIREYDGTRVVNEEVFSGLSLLVGNARYFETVVNGSSQLVKLARKSSASAINLPATTDITDPADSTNQITPSSLVELMQAKLLDKLAGGKDGVLPTSTAWKTEAALALRGNASKREGMYALDGIAPDTFSLMCVPVTSLMTATEAQSIVSEAKNLCKRHYSFLLLGAGKGVARTAISKWFTDLGPNDREYSAGLYPRVVTSDPESATGVRSQDPCGIMAGLIARTDATRGFFKSPAGTEAGFVGGQLEDSLSDLDQEPLNRAGINCLREFPVIGAVGWGARTLAGADALAHQYKYIAVARTALVLEASLRTGLQWAVFEPNDEVLHGNIRLTVDSFMKTLHRQGAFQGRSARDAYFVKCDSDTTTQADIDQGIVNIIVGFAPLKPAEFVMVKIKQIAQAAT